MIRVGIYGYGNIGRGVEKAINESKDLELVAIFTRRNPENVKIYSENIEVRAAQDVLFFIDKIDVMILCGGSATDLPQQTPELSQFFNVVDSFDTHANINDHFNRVNDIALKTKHVGIISIGWDPGLFSVNRVYADAIFNHHDTYTFWGDGVSQGHSDAIRRISGVKYAVQYTRPITEALKQVREGLNPKLTARDKHLRECYLVVDKNADKESIKSQIVTMPNYFAEYNTIVNFISEDEYFNDHCKMPHGGYVISSGKSGNNKHLIEYSLKSDSNPEFTSLILVAYARACYRLYKEGQYGAKTILDIPLSYISPKSNAELRKELL